MFRGSGALEDDAFHHVRDVLAAVDGPFREVVQLLPLDRVDGVPGGVVEFRDGGVVVLVALGFGPVDLDEQFLEGGEVLEVAEVPDRLGQPAACIDQQLALLDELDRVAGRYTLLEDEQTKPRTIYSLARKKRVDLFTLRRRHQLLDPLVDAEYGSATFITANRPARFELRVSLTGLLVREVELAHRPLPLSF